jgi:phytanoyl-CoA hydroxylase
MMEFINEDQYDFYWEQGYLVIENFFSEEEVGHYYQSLKNVATEDFKTLLHLDREEDMIKQNPDCDPESRKHVAKLVRGVQCHPRMIGILEELYEREMVALQSIILFKEKGSPYQSTAWNAHQDNSYVQNKNNLYLAVGYPLLDFYPENGGFYIYPRTHKEGILPFTHNVASQAKVGESPGNTCEVPAEYEKIDVSLKKGDTFIFHGNLVHGSYPNHSNQSRPFLVINYLPYGEDFIPGRTSNRRVIRCH